MNPIHDGCAETFIEGDFRLARQQRIEQSSLAMREPQAAIDVLPEPSDPLIFLEPLFGKQSKRSVAQHHHSITACERPQELRQLHGLTFKIGATLQFEPIDPGGYFNPTAAGLSIEFAFGLDLPTFGDKRSNQRR
jgi:hypothetical protein